MKPLRGCSDKNQFSSNKNPKPNSRNNAYSRQQLMVKSYSRPRIKTQSVRPITISLLRKTENPLDKSKSKNPSLNKIIKKSTQPNSRTPSKSHSHFTSVNEESNINSRNPTKPLTRVDSFKPRSNRQELRRIIDSIKHREIAKQSKEETNKKHLISKSINVRRKESEGSIVKSTKVELSRITGLKYAYRSEEGVLASNPSKTNQDSLLIKSRFCGQDNYLFAVADGHGVCGHHVSKFAVKNLSRLLETALKTLDPIQSFKISFKKIQQMLEESDVNAEYSGTTLISILIRENQLYCANVGDSRAIIISTSKNNNWEISELSRDHKPNIPSERERIIKSGGRIQPFKDQNGDPVGPYRVWLLEQNVQGLAMSRSIGDNISKPVGVTYQPQIISYKLRDKDKIIVMGSDGLWEFIDNQEAATIILQYYLKGKLEDGIDALVNTAYKRWTVEDDSVVDDITVIVVFLDK